MLFPSLAEHLEISVLETGEWRPFVDLERAPFRPGGLGEKPWSIATRLHQNVPPRYGLPSQKLQQFLKIGAVRTEWMGAKLVREVNPRGIDGMHG